MITFVKQSGESLATNGEPCDIWTEDGVITSAERIAAVYAYRQELGTRALAFVSGAGNLIRGNALRGQGLAPGNEDVVGRAATILNTMVLALALREREVPIATFLTPSMRFSDELSTVAFEPYSPEAMVRAFEEEKVVLLAGGTGKNNQSTDTAVLEYAVDYTNSLQQTSQSTHQDIVVVKGTKHNGVYDRDPAKDPDVARRYLRISARTMLADYDRFCAVDEPSLRTIVKHGVSLRVFADGCHDLADVLSAHPDSNGVGTLIVPHDIEPELEAA